MSERGASAAKLTSTTSDRRALFPTRLLASAISDAKYLVKCIFFFFLDCSSNNKDMINRLPLLLEIQPYPREQKEGEREKKKNHPKLGFGSEHH